MRSESMSTRHLPQACARTRASPVARRGLCTRPPGAMRWRSLVTLMPSCTAGKVELEVEVPVGADDEDADAGDTGKGGIPAPNTLSCACIMHSLACSSTIAAGIHVFNGRCDHGLYHCTRGQGAGGGVVHSCTRRQFHAGRENFAVLGVKGVQLSVENLGARQVQAWMNLCGFWFSLSDNQDSGCKLLLSSSSPAHLVLNCAAFGKRRPKPVWVLVLCE
ncbi:hypothetical protein B0H10DRAFT_1955508 [Mycena sp. CBHHK59/15]|nr:hypothetical protein B0H10DRAFT_1955508 [Mycena sp. CBHHK59/15]